MPHFQCALTIREQVLGLSRPKTATTLNNLATLYGLMDNYPEALPLFQRALAICEQALGPSYPATVTIQELAYRLEQMMKIPE